MLFRCVLQVIKTQLQVQFYSIPAFTLYKQITHDYYDPVTVCT